MKFPMWMAVCLLLVSTSAFAQQSKDTPAAVPYKVTFVISELQDGKKINQRTYSMILANDRQQANVKTGSRVPVGTAEKAFQYLDVGVNINLRLAEVADWLSLDGDLDASGVLPASAESSANGVIAPIIRQNRLILHAMVRPDKPTVIGSLDDVNSTRTTQIEVTATRLK